MPGTLFVVATPIGNLEDLTFRALRTLREVDVIAAEDTRRTAKLLAHYEIRKPTLSYREHNEARETPKLLARLDRGDSIALVTDAGTPGLADPGARLVSAARQAGHPVVPIPGASAVATALSASGLEFDEFVFMGFPPASGSARIRWFERLAADQRVAVIFEAPHRVRRTLEEIRLDRSNSQILAFRELTKINEQFIDCTNISDVESMPTRGEFVIVVDPADRTETERPLDLETARRISNALESAGFTRDESLNLTATALGVAVRPLKKALKAARMSGK